MLISFVACGVPNLSELVEETGLSKNEETSDATDQGNDGEDGTNLEDFVKVMTDIKGCGDRLYAVNMPIQGEFFYSFAGSAIGSLRFATEYILWLKGEGDSLASFTEDSAYVGWDALLDAMRTWEDKLYANYMPKLVGLNRGMYFGESEGIEEKLLECLNAEDYEGAYDYAKAELRANPFEVMPWRGAALCALIEEDYAQFGAYVDEGLMEFPDDEILLGFQKATVEVVTQQNDARRVLAPLAFGGASDAGMIRLASSTGDGLIDFRVMNGIDYGRLMQKTGNGARSYPVELQIGSLLFRGDLSGDMGLSIEEMNDIIRQVLSQTGMTVEEIQSVTGFVAQAQSDAKWEMGSQIAAAVLSFVGIEQVPKSLGKLADLKNLAKAKDVFANIAKAKGVSFGDIYKGIRYNKDLDPGSTVIGLGAGGVAAYLPEIAKKLDGKGFAKRILPATKVAPVAGQVITAVLVGKDLWDADKKLDTRLKGLEDRAAAVVGFYALCSQKANHLPPRTIGLNFEYRLTSDTLSSFQMNEHLEIWGTFNTAGQYVMLQDPITNEQKIPMISESLRSNPWEKLEGTPKVTIDFGYTKPD